MFCCYLTDWAGKNDRHILDDIFKCFFQNENMWISIKISLKFVSKCLNNNIPALVQITAWRRPGDKPLSEPMLFNLLTNICVTRSLWVNTGASLTKSNKLNQHRLWIEAWRSNYIYLNLRWNFGMYECLHPQETIDVITYPCHNFS